VLDEQMKAELIQTKFYGIVVDESTDLSVNKNLIIYVRYVCPSDLEIKTKLIGDIRIADGTASTIANEVRNQLKCIGLESVNLVGLGSDGASVMFGRKTGVGVQLKQDASFMTHVHCVHCGTSASTCLF
jgi:protein involved in polysaccharide export with SLBB domain